jgi:hypothetical protein
MAPLACMNKNTFQSEILIPFVSSSCLLPDICAGQIVREPWWMNQEFSSVDIVIPQSLSILLHHLGLEQ